MYSNREVVRKNRATESNALLALSKNLPLSRSFCLILILVSGLFASQQVLALTCVLSTTSASSFTESIANSIAIPQSVPDGTIVWRSELRVLPVKCYMTGAFSAEAVKAYYNPASIAMPTGITLGANINGVNVDAATSSSTNGVAIGITVPTCSNSAGCPSTGTTFNASYYIYAKKSGSRPSGTYPLASFKVFQLDGSGGMNNVAGSNLVYSASNLGNIRFITCNATASVSPNLVNFGSIVANKPVIGNVVKERNFTITVSKTCSDPVKVSTTYSSLRSIINGNEVDLGKGLSLQIKNLNTGNYIIYNNVESIADLSSMNSVTVPFLAQLKWNKNTAVKGSINSAVTFTFSYN
ncbi:fimbrial protein [Yersinia aldovae]|uniref:fimbrial protein n=1 Tax=Yersinia aldovae TaxID=29483 RepID=UPI0005DF36B1|nr:hypothetical protein [Yersinia aldovae]CNG96585.1 fimbrial protein [Yersinia aldovae]